MATNFFFNNYQSSQEQQLLENLIIEAIRVYGSDMYYLPRKLNNYDSIYGADDQSSYEEAFPIEMYIKSIDGFSGDGSFMSKFGIEIRDQVIFSTAQKVFSQEIAQYTGQLRPNEGDIIFFPLNGKCFQITYVNKYEMFYQLGALQTWEMTCDLFEYSNEIFNTGIPEIDKIQKQLSNNILDYAIRDENGDFLLNEDEDYIVMENYMTAAYFAAVDNDEIQKESDDFVDWSVYDPFSEGKL